MTKIRRALLKDIPAIVDFSPAFFAESNFRDCQFDPVATAGTAARLIEGEDSNLFLALDDEKIVGFICYEIVAPFSVEKVAQLFAVYVLPSHRLSEIGDALFDVAELAARLTGAFRFYASATAGFSDSGKTEKRMLNLYRRRGYAELGCFVMKELK